VRPIREALELLRKVTGHQLRFDPATADRTFRICMTDISQIVLLPRLLARVRAAAPQVRIDVAEISAATPKTLESGEADIALGFMPQLEAGFFQQKLFSQHFICMASRDHPRIREKLSLKQFREESHLLVTASGTGHWIVDKVMEQHKLERRIVLRVPGFLGLGAMVASTDLIAVVPRILGELLVKRERIHLYESPIKLPTYQVKQHWHERYHHDPGNQWLRRVVAELFCE